MFRLVSYKKLQMYIKNQNFKRIYTTIFTYVILTYLCLFFNCFEFVFNLFTDHKKFH